MPNVQRIAAIGSLIAAVAASLAFAAPAKATTSYVALGDSYSSGTGTRSYIDDGTSCQRSTRAYPSLIAAAKGYALNLRACSGATIPDVANGQLSALTGSTTQVSISIGGNDAGFADVLTECAKPAWMSNCNGAIDRAQSFIDNELPSQLSGLYAAIRSKAPNARVVVVGYPRLFQGEDCNAGTWFSPEEQARLNQTADLINAHTSTQASNRGLGFADPTSRFIGYAVCDDVEWINGLSYPISESYHPNSAGHRDGYTPVVSPPLTGAAVSANARTRERADTFAAALGWQQRQYAAQDRAITPKVMKAPDLTTAEARRAAARAGVDLTSRRSIDEADARYSRAQTRQR